MGDAVEVLLQPFWDPPPTDGTQFSSSCNSSQGNFHCPAPGDSPEHPQGWQDGMRPGQPGCGGGRLSLGFSQAAAHKSAFDEAEDSHSCQGRGKAPSH